MHLEKDLCEHYCAQMTIKLRSSIGKWSIEKEHPFLTRIVSIMNSWSIQYNELFQKYANVAQKDYSFCQEKVVPCPFQIKSIIFIVNIYCFNDGILHCFTFLSKPSCLLILFAHTFFFLSLRKKVQLQNQFFERPVNVALRLQLV